MGLLQTWETIRHVVLRELQNGRCVESFLSSNNPPPHRPILDTNAADIYNRDRYCGRL